MYEGYDSIPHIRISEKVNAAFLSLVGKWHRRGFSSTASAHPVLACHIALSWNGSMRDPGNGQLTQKSFFSAALSRLKRGRKASTFNLRGTCTLVHSTTRHDVTIRYPRTKLHLYHYGSLRLPVNE